MTGHSPARTSKSEHAYLALRARILGGDYSPGHRLILARLAAQLGVSVVPVREAVRRLEAERLVVFEPNIGATVAGIDATEYQHVMQTLSIVESAATALALPRLSKADLLKAERLNQRLQQGLKSLDPVHFTTLNREFHETLYLPCPNPHLLDLVRRGWSRLSALRTSTFNFIPDRADQSVAEHAELLRQIRAGVDPDRIEHYARRHRQNTLGAYLSHCQSSATSLNTRPAEKSTS